MPVNEQVCDSVTQVNTATIGGAPSMGAGNLLMSTSQALGNAAHNAINSNQMSTITLQSTVIQSINALFATGNSVIGRSTESIVEKG